MGRWSSTSGPRRPPPRTPCDAAPRPPTLAGGRRDRPAAFLGGVAAASGALVVATAGGTVRPLGDLAVLGQRRPGVGPQGLPVNKTAAAARVVEVARDPAYRLVVEGAVARRWLTLDDLAARPSARPPCRSRAWRGGASRCAGGGVPVRDLLALAGAAPGARVEVAVESLQPSGLYRASVLDDLQAARSRHPAGARHRRRGAAHRPRLPGPAGRPQPARRVADQVGEPAGGVVTPSSPDTTSRRGLLSGWRWGTRRRLRGVGRAARGRPRPSARAGPVGGRRGAERPRAAADRPGRRLGRPPPGAGGAWPAVRTGLIVTGVPRAGGLAVRAGLRPQPVEPVALPPQLRGRPSDRPGAGVAVRGGVVGLRPLAHRATSRASTSHRPAPTAQDTPTRSTTNTSVSSGPMTPPAPATRRPGAAAASGGAGRPPACPGRPGPNRR